MTAERLPVFLNGRMISVASGTTLLALVAQEEPALAPDLAAGRALAVDGRGIALEPTATLAAGAIIRVYRSARTTDGATDA